MAYSSSDGKKFTNRAPMMSHNRSVERMGEKSSGAGLAEKVDPLAQPAHEEPDGDEQDGASIAEEHGPAHEVHMKHDHEGGMHHVHSMHPDGHEHHSDHGSAEEAHDHAKKLAGGGGEEHEMGQQEEEPEYE